MVIDGEMISEDAFVAAAERVHAPELTFFEQLTAIALLAIADARPEVTVLEVGLGGRLDATTVGTPEAVVIARIDLDHQAVLGATLAEIAAEKAAIIRGGVAVCAAQAPEAERVLVERAAAVRVSLLLEGRELSVAVERRGPEGQRLTCAGPGWRMSGLELGMLGTFQPSNALLAVATARQLGVREAAIHDGLARAWWPGRFQILRREGGLLVLDGAHNPAGARALAASLRETFGDRRVTFVVGILRDKDAAGIIGALAPLADRFVLVASSSPRAVAVEALRALVPGSAGRVEVAGTPGDALALAARIATTPIVCVAGSLSLIGDVLRHVAGSDQPCSLERGAESMGLLFS